MTEKDTDLKTPLDFLCVLHNIYDERHLHDALQHLEDAVATNPNMSALEFLTLWHAATIVQQQKDPIDYSKEVPR